MRAPGEHLYRLRYSDSCTLIGFEPISPLMSESDSLEFMARYLYTTEGTIVGYFDDENKYLYTNTRPAQIISYFNDERTYMYTMQGKVYGYTSDDGKYLYQQNGQVIGYFDPVFTK